MATVADLLDKLPEVLGVSQLSVNHTAKRLQAADLLGVAEDKLTPEAIARLLIAIAFDIGPKSVDLASDMRFTGALTMPRQREIPRDKPSMKPFIGGNFVSALTGTLAAGGLIRSITLGGQPGLRVGSINIAPAGEDEATIALRYAGRHDEPSATGEIGALARYVTIHKAAFVMIDGLLHPQGAGPVEESADVENSTSAPETAGAPVSLEPEMSDASASPVGASHGYFFGPGGLGLL